MAIRSFVLCLTFFFASCQSGGMSISVGSLAQAQTKSASAAVKPDAGPDAGPAEIEGLRGHVKHLAGTIGERNVFKPKALAAAAAYITREWRAQGYEVITQTYKAEGVTVGNLEVKIGKSTAGDKNPRAGPGILLVGAHYDTVAGTPGADDNASGVAALLELSRLLAKTKPKSEIRFVAFTNEEPPFFQTGLMGSLVYAHDARQRGDDIRFMVSLETLGFYSDKPGSQKYPPLFDWFYPDRGNFIGFVSDFGSGDHMGRLSDSFRAKTKFPVETVRTFQFVPGVGWSDHWSFWQRDYPAVMVTDTAPFRNPHYHRETDKPETLDYARLTRVTSGLYHAIRAFADQKKHHARANDEADRLPD